MALSAWIFDCQKESKSDGRGTDGPILSGDTAAPRAKWFAGFDPVGAGVGEGGSPLISTYNISGSVPSTSIVALPEDRSRLPVLTVSMLFFRAVQVNRACVSPVGDASVTAQPTFSPTW